MKIFFGIVIISYLVIFVLLMSLFGAESTTRDSKIVLRLPSDCYKVLNIDNGKNGVVVGYIGKDGVYRAIQYSGSSYDNRHIFELR